MKKEEFDKFIELQIKEEKNKKQIFENKLYKFFLILGYFWIFFIESKSTPSLDTINLDGLIK